jgi:hypothetical protein
MQDEEEWTEKAWQELIDDLEEGECTPFLGAGASAKVLPKGSELALELAEMYGYPFPDTNNLVRVSQFAVVKDQSSRGVKRHVARRLRAAQPDFENPDEVHRVVAGLRLPVYITTNYDDFLMQALNRLEHPKVEAHQIVCNWYQERDLHLKPRWVTDRPEFAIEARKGKELVFEPSPETPVVFHLHGKLGKRGDWKTIVLTEDDYLDFLIYVHDLPSRIELAFTDSSFLFLGYSLEDMDFKVLFRKLASYPLNERRRHVAVQLKPAGRDPTEEEIKRAHDQAKYMEEQLGLMAIRIFWGSCERFASELRKRWESRGDT